jgi:putative ABC transport system ATP-binding protein
VSAAADGPVRPVIQLARVTKTYVSGDLEVHALQGVDLVVGRGEFVALMGASGSGKSTMMNIIGCLDVPTRGRFHVDGVDVRTIDERQLARVRNRKIGFVFQSFNLLPRTTALANVELPLAYAGVRRRDRGPRARAALDVVGLGDRADHLPSQLSGGQQQRVAIARALVTGPALLLADEPTGNLDSTSTHDVMAVLRDLNTRGRSIVVITHERDVAAYAERVVTLRDGRVVDDAPVAPDLRLVPRAPVAAPALSGPERG